MPVEMRQVPHERRLLSSSPVSPYLKEILRISLGKTSQSFVHGYSYVIFSARFVAALRGAYFSGGTRSAARFLLQRDAVCFQRYPQQASLCLQVRPLYGGYAGHSREGTG